jgi:hypothetical protein
VIEVARERAARAADRLAPTRGRVVAVDDRTSLLDEPEQQLSTGLARGASVAATLASAAGTS